MIRKKSAALLQVITLYSPNRTYDAIYLSNYATINVIDALARINGVGQVQLFGPLDYSMRIWLDPDKLTEFNLTPSDVVAAVQAQNIQAALGRIGAAPIANDQRVQLTIKTKGRLSARRNSPPSCCAPIPTARSCGSRTSRASRWAQDPGPPQPLQWRAGGGDRHLPDARLQRRRRHSSCARNHDYPGDAFPQ